MNLVFSHQTRILSIFVPLLLLLAISCATEIGLGETFRLHEGGSARVGGVIVHFVEVAEDSRCPPDVDCFWEGDAHVRLTLDGNPVSLHTSHSLGRTARVGRHTVELLALSRSEYVAELRLGE